jgi:hypothetical protein
LLLDSFFYLVQLAYQANGFFGLRWPAVLGFNKLPATVHPALGMG